ncbi:Gfo/Idh/MocA family protein [Streptomyces mirabilis]|uniref:Gfo/Idh/MocA family protein n=1 Tax=Streptomyces mirabilis TaxID=68239 RepID=UPI0036D93ADA
MTDEPLRIGVLVAVAARDRDRAEAFTARHGVERVADSYASLVTDPEIEVVYNPLANSLHGPWNLAALQAGKHVLTEKPSASNAAEAAEVHEAVAKAGTVFMEGFHYLFHPVTRRLHELLDSGELGDLRHVETTVAMPAPPDDDVRWQLPLAGGALMDLGCYSLHAQRMLAPWAGGAPRLVAARGGEKARAAGVDEWLDVDLEFPGGATGSARCHMAHRTWQMSCRVVGSRGEATAVNFVQPHLDDRVVVRTAAGERTEELGRRSSYTYQLEAFATHLRRGTPLTLDAADALTTMRLIDDCYRAAGFPVRPRTVLPATA